MSSKGQVKKGENEQCLSEQSYPVSLAAFRIENTFQRGEMKAQVLKQFEMRLANVFRKRSVIKECLF